MLFLQRSRFGRTVLAELESNQVEHFSPTNLTYRVRDIFKARRLRNIVATCTAVTLASSISIAHSMAQKQKMNGIY